MRKLTTGAALLAVASLYAETFTNPVVDADWPDPTVWQGGDGCYYSVATGLRTVRQSRNLVEWVDMERSPLTPEARFALTNLTGNVWAPSVAKIGNRWVMHVSLFISDADNRIQALVSDSPSGPFSFHGNVIDSRREGIRNTIDPYSFVEDGHVWMFFGSCQDGIHRVELTPDGLSILPGSKPVHVAGHRRDPRNPRNLWGVAGAYEGSYVFKHKGLWYLFVSFGKFDNGTYCLTVGRATSVTGVFRDRQGRPLTEGLAEPILKGQPGARFFGPGHNGNVFTSPDGRTWMFYHAHDRKRACAADRPMLLQELKWTEDGWPFFNGCAPEETVDCATTMLCWGCRSNTQKLAGNPLDAASEPVGIIFDTDMLTDFDDVGALACLHALADAGECRILATISSTRGNASVGAVEVINGYYGRGDLPVGATKGDAMAVLA